MVGWHDIIGSGNHYEYLNTDKRRRGKIEPGAGPGIFNIGGGGVLLLFFSVVLRLRALPTYSINCRIKASRMVLLPLDIQDIGLLGDSVIRYAI